jgi:hypothetical protein
MIVVNLFLDPLSIHPRKVFWFVLNRISFFQKSFRRAGTIYVRTLSGRKKKVMTRGDKQEFAFALRIGIQFIRNGKDETKSQEF